MAAEAVAAVFVPDATATSPEGLTQTPEHGDTEIRPISEHWTQRYADALLNLFGPPLEVLSHGKGVYVWNQDGKRYLDMLGGIAVNALGHAHPDYVAAVSEQVATLGQISNFFTSEPQVRLAERLLEISGAPEGSRVFFANSGTEAIEAAIKLSRRLGPGGLHEGPVAEGQTPRTRVLALANAFHGRTLGALSLTHKAAYREPFSPLPATVEFLAVHGGDPDFDPFAALQEAFSPEAVAARGPVAALFVEPIQGEAGVRPLPEGYLERARELTKAAGALLVVDEIQTGVGRIGAWFAFADSGIIPDVVTLAKGLGGGLPIGAVITFGPEVSSLLSKGQHGTTFGGNPVTTAAALTVLDVIERDGLLENARERGQELRERILALGNPAIAGVRGAGLLLAVELAAPNADEVVRAGMDSGVILNAVNANSIRRAPALIITSADIDAAIDFFATVS
ncbi:MAG: acetylornithine transaminase [Cellulomonadaceae bacterium]|jgi:acetylornithine aminotransferase|nr:acetylornithine transaminase [Cellulomonadaceae bacterium]